MAVDPWRWRDGAATVVLLTDARIDSGCAADVLAAAGESGTALVPESAAARWRPHLGRRLVALAEGESWESSGILVHALAHAGPERYRGFHPRGEGRSYLVESGGEKLLFLGASDALPEHEDLAPAVAFFSVGGFTSMTPDEAAAAASRVRPELALPLGWGDLCGRFASARRFVQLCEASGIRAATRSVALADEGYTSRPEDRPCSSSP